MRAPVLPHFPSFATGLNPSFQIAEDSSTSDLNMHSLFRSQAVNDIISPVIEDYTIIERRRVSMPANKVGQIADALRDQILAKRFGEGRLPTGKDLAKRFGVSRDTIQKVLTRLEAEGLLEGVGERGAVIRRSNVRIPGSTARFDLAIQEQGYDPFEENIDPPALVPAPLEVARALGVEEGIPVVRRFRVQGAQQQDGRDIIKTPYKLAENFYPVTRAFHTSESSQR